VWTCRFDDGTPATSCVTLTITIRLIFPTGTTGSNNFFEITSPPFTTHYYNCSSCSIVIIITIMFNFDDAKKISMAVKLRTNVVYRGRLVENEIIVCISLPIESQSGQMYIITIIIILLRWHIGTV